MCISIIDCEKTINNNFKIYPNPTNGEINIVTNKELDIRIFNIVGNEVYSDTLSIGQNTINLIHLNKGVYFILDSSHLTHKVVIE